MNYMKAYKVNSGIENAIENNEGYNKLAIEQINDYLTNFGYRVDNNGSKTCAPTRTQVNSEGNVVTGKLMTSPYSGGKQRFKYCIYEFPKNDKNYFTYGVVTYIYVDIPMISNYFAIPVYSETEKIYEYGVR